MKTFLSSCLAYLLGLHSVFCQHERILINEFLYDPGPVVGLPDAEYVELINTNANPVRLTEWELNGHPIPEVILLPGQFLVLCEERASSKFDPAVNTLGLVSWDKLNNGGQVILLTDESGRPMDSVRYDDNWIVDPLKKNGGWSLERINPMKTCPDKTNWSVSVNLQGGTPGFNNSVFNASPDTVPPKVSELKWLDAFSLQVTFTEVVNFNVKRTQDLFGIAPGTIPFEMLVEDYSNHQVLHWIIPPDTGKMYQITVRDVPDCAGNQLKDTLLNTGLGGEPAFNEVLLTELLVDEVPSAGLPESEYIEILNNSGGLLDTRNTYIYANSNTYTLPPVLLEPGKYYLLVPDSRKDLFHDYENIIPLSRFPRLRNDGLLLALYNIQKGLVFSLAYTKQWYKNSSRSEGGYALEMIDVNNPCGAQSNWTVSIANVGGTPGAVNSVAESNPDLSGPEILSAYYLESGNISILFSEKLHPASFTGMSLELDDRTVTDAWFYDTLTLDKMVLIYQADQTRPGTQKLEINGVIDCVGNWIGEGKNTTEVHLPDQPDAGDIVINEILFNPKPGGVDWVEIYNNSEKYIDVKGWQTSNSLEQRFEVNSADPGSTAHGLIRPYGFLVMTTDIEQLLADFPFAERVLCLEVKDLPSLPDESGQFQLLDKNGQILDMLQYEEDMHSPFLRYTEGVSLERISPALPSLDRNNWHSASTLTGYGTPTRPNSQYLAQSEASPEITLSPRIFSPDGDGRDDLLGISITHQHPGFMASLYIFNVRGKVIRKLVDGALLGTSDQFQWDGTLDKGYPAAPGHYILVAELFHPDGSTSILKQSLALVR